MKKTGINHPGNGIHHTSPTPNVSGFIQKTCCQM